MGGPLAIEEPFQGLVVLEDGPTQVGHGDRLTSTTGIEGGIRTLVLASVA